MWWTGTVEDQFTPIYVAMAQKTALHGQCSPPEVDEMDLITVWALMGVGQQEKAQAEAAAQFRAPAPGPGMVPLTAEEKAARYAARQDRRTPRRSRT